MAYSASVPVRQEVEKAGTQRDPGLFPTLVTIMLAAFLDSGK